MGTVSRRDKKRIEHTKKYYKKEMITIKEDIIKSRALEETINKTVGSIFREDGQEYSEEITDKVISSLEDETKKANELRGNIQSRVKTLWKEVNFDLFVTVYEYAKANQWITNDTETEIENLEPVDIIYVADKLLKEKNKPIEQFTSRDWTVLKNRLAKYAETKDTKAKNPKAYKELGYFKLAQSPASNSLSHMMGKPAQLDIDGNGIIKDERITIFIQQFMELTNGIRESAVKLLDRLIVEKTEDRSFDTTLAQVPLKEYMENRGLKDEKEARAQVNEDLNAINKITIALFRDKRNGDWLDIKICSGTKGIKNGIIYLGFNEQFLQMMNYGTTSASKYLYGFIPVDAFKTDSRYNPHAYYFIRRIIVHKRMNRGKDNEDIIPIKSLMDASPTLRKYEELDKKKVTQYLINPIEKNLDHLSEKIKVFKWEWIGDPPTTYDELLNARVKTYWSEYPSFQTVIDKGSKYAKLKDKAEEKAIKDKLYKQYLDKKTDV